MPLRLTACLLLLCVSAQLASGADAENGPKIKALIIDGQNNHAWQTTTPLLKKALESSGRFTVDVATSPPAKHDMSHFKPNFADYGVVVSNYNGDPWSKETQQAFVDYVHGGGGFVVVHAANNSFGNWKEYNEMIGLGGWGGRNEKSGPYVYYKNDKQVVDPAPGGGGSHGPQHPFQIVLRDTKHPITAGLSERWMHAQDELYSTLRGPAKNLHVLGTAYAAKGQGGRDVDEPLLMTIDYGQGRVFHTALGHADYSIKCAGFITLLNRGAEWAATGKVTIPVPADFPTADKVSSRKL